MINITITELQQIYDFNNTLINVKVIVEGIDPNNPEYAHGFPFVIEGADLAYLQQFTQGTVEYADALHALIDNVAIDHFNAQHVSGTLDVILNEEELEQALAGKLTTTASELLSLEGKKTRHKADVARARYAYETQGVTWTDSENNSLVFSTDSVSQGKLSAARLILSQGGRADNSVWKCFDSTLGKSVFKPLTNDEFVIISDLIYAHVQKCFEAERRCFDAIDSATTEEEINTVSYKNVYEAV